MLGFSVLHGAEHVLRLLEACRLLLGGSGGVVFVCLQRIAEELFYGVCYPFSEIVCESVVEENVRTVVAVGQRKCHVVIGYGLMVFLHVEKTLCTGIGIYGALIR